MLEGYHRRQETFCILECLLCGNGLLQCFGPTLQEISSSFQNLCTLGQKTAVKVYHAEKTLQLLDIIRGGGQFLISVALLAVGATPAAEIMWPRISREGVANTLFSKLTVRPLAAKALKKCLQIVEVCLPVRRTNT
jgi:hypothetical protein